MRLLDRLISFVHDKFNRYAQGAAAISFTHNESLVVVFSDEAVTFFNGGFERLSIDLDDTLTIQGINAQMAVVFPTSTANALYASRLARALIDSDSTFNAETGLYSYTLLVPYSLLYLIMLVYAKAIKSTQLAVIEALKQLYLHSAETNWLDEWGGYFGVARDFDNGEADADFRDRMIASLLKPKCNNVAMEAAINALTGQDVTITDSVTPTWFGVTTGFNLLGGESPTGFAAKMASIVNQIKAAGTRFEITLSAAVIGDTMPVITIDRLAVTITTNHLHDGTHRHNGAIRHTPETTHEIL